MGTARSSDGTATQPPREGRVLRVDPIRLVVDVADPTMHGTVFYERFLEAVLASSYAGTVVVPKHDAVPVTEVVIPAEDTGNETNWPRYGRRSLATTRGAFSADRLRLYLDRLVLDGRAFCALAMNPFVPVGAWLSGSSNAIVADVNLTTAKRARDPRAISMPAPPFIVGDGSSERRDLLASFRGASSHPVRDRLARSADAPNVVVELLGTRGHVGRIDAVSGAGDDHYAGLLRRSVFGLVPRGDCHFSYRLLEVMSFGCIPVVLSDDLVLPYDRIVPWRSIALHVPEERAGDLGGLLRSVPPERIEKMRAGVMAVYRRWFRSLPAMVDGLTVEIAVVRAMQREGMI